MPSSSTPPAFRNPDPRRTFCTSVRLIDLPGSIRSMFTWGLVFLAQLPTISLARDTLSGSPSGKEEPVSQHALHVALRRRRLQRHPKLRERNRATRSGPGRSNAPGSRHSRDARTQPCRRRFRPTKIAPFVELAVFSAAAPPARLRESRSSGRIPPRAMAAARRCGGEFLADAPLPKLERMAGWTCVKAVGTCDLPVLRGPALLLRARAAFSLMSAWSLSLLLMVALWLVLAENRPS